MPSHPDRVRRNYHTVRVATGEDRRTESLEVRLSITKTAIASWAHPRVMRQEMARQLMQAFERVMTTRAR